MTAKFEPSAGHGRRMISERYSEAGSLEGWIKLHRKILEWQWWDDRNVVRLWIYILLRANHSARKWQGRRVPAGTFITSYPRMSEDTGLTVGELRTAMRKLKESGCVTTQPTNRYQAVSVVHWKDYQGVGRQPGTAHQAEAGYRRDTGQKKAVSSPNWDGTWNSKAESVWDAKAGQSNSPGVRTQGSAGGNAKAGKGSLYSGRTVDFAGGTRQASGRNPPEYGENAASPGRPEADKPTGKRRAASKQDTSNKKDKTETKEEKRMDRRPAKNRFHNFPQRGIDYNAIARRALEERLERDEFEE